MDGFRGRDSGGLLEYIKFMAAGIRGCRGRERSCNLNVGKEGGRKNRKCGFAEEELCLMIMSVEETPNGSVYQHRTRNLSGSLTGEEQKY